MKNDLLLATGQSKLTIINVNSYSVIRTIYVSGSDSIYTAYLITNDMMLACD